MDELRGEQVVLRPLADADAEALIAIHHEPAVAEWWGAMADGFPLTDEPEVTRFTIVVDGEVAGLIQYGEESEPDYRHAWIDLFVASRLHGHGIGTDAVRTLMRHLIDERGHHRVTIDPAIDNVKAVRSYEKAGFRRVGVMKSAWRDANGNWRDALFMERVELP
jgi:aminoglycoside 6'-N-acetyltransferase